MIRVRAFISFSLEYENSVPGTKFSVSASMSQTAESLSVMPFAHSAGRLKNVVSNCVIVIERLSWGTPLKNFGSESSRLNNFLLQRNTAVAVKDLVIEAILYKVPISGMFCLHRIDPSVSL